MQEMNIKLYQYAGNEERYKRNYIGCVDYKGTKPLGSGGFINIYSGGDDTIVKEIVLDKSAETPATRAFDRGYDAFVSEFDKNNKLERMIAYYDNGRSYVFFDKAKDVNELNSLRDRMHDAANKIKIDRFRKELSAFLEGGKIPEALLKLVLKK